VIIGWYPPPQPLTQLSREINRLFAILQR